MLLINYWVVFEESIYVRYLRLENSSSSCKSVVVVVVHLLVYPAYFIELVLTSGKII